MLAVPVVKNWGRTRGDPQALETARGIVGLYLGVWFLCFFGLGAPRYLRGAAASAAERAATARSIPGRDLLDRQPLADFRLDSEQATRFWKLNSRFIRDGISF